MQEVWEAVAACVDGRKRRHCTSPYEFGNVCFLTERLTEGTLTAQSAECPKADIVCSRPSGLIIVISINVEFLDLTILSIQKPC